VKAGFFTILKIYRFFWQVENTNV